MGDTPKQVGRYRIERPLGSGSMGNVYLAHDSDLDRWVAIKTLRDVGLDAETRAMFIRRFQNEARAAARLQHPNIVQIFDVGDDPLHGLYLVFEYVPGSTLKKQIRAEGPLETKALLEVAQQIANALSTAHVAGVIHRDLKPENLLITENGQVKLADFGIARVPNAQLTKEGQFLGTPCYSAPETLSSAQYDVKSDLFSLGAVLYELICGVRAFPGGDAIAVAHQVMHKDPVPPSEASRGATIPPEVDRVIMKSLSKQPENRYPSAQALMNALGDAYRGTGASTKASPERARWGLPIAALMLALLGSGLWFFMREPQPTPSERSETTMAPVGIDPLEATDPEPSLPEGEIAGSEADPKGDASDAVNEPDDDLTPHEREERAKDELARARQALERGDLATAKDALDKAAAFDPKNPDIDALRSEVGGAPSPTTD